MTDIVPALGAIAATIAAILAGLNLWVVGKREERRWTREALVDVLVAYLQTSFRNEARAILEGRLRGCTEQQLALWRGTCDDAHADQMQTLTRLRLLAPASLIAAAEELHTADHEVTTYASEVPDADVGPAWQDLRQRQRSAREAVIVHGRTAIGVGNGAAIGHWGGRDASSLGAATAGD